MKKRFTDTDIWLEDWFIDLEDDYIIFWFYLKDSCDHAGVWKPNIKMFNLLYNKNIDIEKAIDIYNKGKERIRVLDNGYWFLPCFFVFQYGTVMNLNNNAHKSVYNIYNKLGIKIDSENIKGLLEVKEGSKRGLRGPKEKTKDKEQDKEQDKEKDKKGKKKFTPPKVEGVIEYFKEKGYTEESAIKAFEYYDTAGWKDSTGKKVKNWKQKMIAVWFKPENKHIIKEKIYTNLGK